MIIDQVFNGIDFKTQSPQGTTFEHCHFSNCTFQAVNLTNTAFSECTFEACDLSTAQIANTAFKEVAFIDCKLLGLPFENCNKFLLQFSFTNCQVNYASFYQLKIPKTIFKNCSLQQADFTGADLRNAAFLDCNLSGAVFENTTLIKADLTTAQGFTIDLEKNTATKARFSQSGLHGLLTKYRLSIE